MNAKSFIAAAAMLACAATAFAAEAPDAPAAASATASGSNQNLNANLNLPTLGAPSDTTREEAKAEARDVVKNYKTTLSVQLDQYKN